MKKTIGFNGPLVILGASLSAAAAALTGAEVKDVTSEIEGDTQCIQSATRHYYTWMDYNNTMAALLRQGEPYDRESMKWEADRERRASWRQPERRLSHVHLALGRVDGEENTRFGSIPADADIGVGYLHDWSVHDRYGYGSDHQPRVESVTEIVIKPEFSATIEYVNDIQMIAKGSISGTADARDPWPQQGEHDAALTAIDIHGKQHRLSISARATAMPTNARSRTNSQSSTTKWTVSGGVSVSSGGPSADIGGSYEESETVSSSRSRSSSVPAVAGASYNKDYSDGTKKVVEIDCGGVSRVSRAVQINGHFYTKSFAQGGSVASEGTHGVTNTLRIKVTCTPCEGRTGDPDGGTDDPPGTPRDPKGPITPSGESGYGSKAPDPFAPRDRNGVTITPAQGGAADPSSFWDNPIIKGGGCIYIDPRYLPPFVVPVEQGTLGDPGFDPDALDLDESRIPLVVPDGSNRDDSSGDALVPLGHLMPESRIQPAAGALVVINPGSNLVTIDGGFWVAAPDATDRDYYGNGAVIKFQPGASVHVDGPYEIAALDGSVLRLVEQEGIRVHQLIDAGGDASSPEALVHGQVVEILRSPGTLLFSRVGTGESDDAAVQSEVDLRMGAIRRIGSEVTLAIHANWNDVPLVVQRSTDIGQWEDLAELAPSDRAELPIQFRCATEPAQGTAFFRAVVVPERPRLLAPLGDESRLHMIERVRIALAGVPVDFEPVIADHVDPLFAINREIRELVMTLETGGADPLRRAGMEVELQALETLRRQLRRDLDAILAGEADGVGD